MRFHRKNIRLPADQYLGKRVYFLTSCCEERRPVFQAHAHADWLIRGIRERSAEHHIELHAYCVMPDHVHLLVEGVDAACDLLRFAKLWKQATGYEYQRDTGQRLWQKKFYDQILRPGDAMDAVAWYIWMNPVRKGLADVPQAYPYSGSATLTWPVKVVPLDPWVPPWKRLTKKPTVPA